MRFARTEITLLVVTAITICGVALAQRRESDKRSTLIGKVPNEVFTTTVDWYKPWSQGPSEGEVNVPNELIQAVPKPLLEEATALLGDADSTLLTNEQSARFSSIGDPDTRIEKKIQELLKEAKFFRENPFDAADILKRYGKDEVEVQKQREQRIIDDLNSEARRLRKWKNQLRPYLIKAVSLEAGGIFYATFIGSDLVVDYMAMGSAAAPMERRPVVAFLPRQPHKVYTNVGMIE